MSADAKARPDAMGREIDTAPIAEWLVTQGLLATPAEDLLPPLLRRLEAAGGSVWRAHLATRMLHPQYEGYTVTAFRGEAADRESFSVSAESREPWEQSPLSHFLGEIAASYPATRAEGDEARSRAGRYRLEIGEGLNRFPLLQTLAAGGGTDYVMMASPYGFDGGLALPIRDGVLSSWTADRPGGFRSAEIAALARIHNLPGLALRPGMLMEAERTLLSTYIGADAGRRVLAGDIKRAQAEALDAALLIADLRGFTGLADTLPGERLMPLLDGYLECMAEPVESEGGQVLKFLGDGLLATFPLGEGERGCAAAAAAATEIQQRVADLNSRRCAAGEPVTVCDIALHRGAVMYGNVGANTRLDFTVIGPAVNEAARIEALCQELGRPILASSAFVAAAGADSRFVSLGAHALRGVRHPQELFGLR